MNFSFNTLFASQDSKFTIRTALLVTLVPLLMMGIIIYSAWLLISFNHSYFISHGFPLDEKSRETFLLFLLQAQIEYIPYIGLFFIGVFFLGIFLSYLILRPFTQISMICQETLNANGRKIKIVGLNRKKTLVKLGNFLCEYYDEKVNKQGQAKLPKDLLEAKGPMTDRVFYFQFCCLILILTAITVSAIHVFSLQLQEAIVHTAISALKGDKGMIVFLESQSDIFDLIILVPSIVSCILYAIIGKLIISKIEGTTFAYVRDIRTVAEGFPAKRLTPRADDPGKEAAYAVNQLLESIHPMKTNQSDKTLEMSNTIKAVPSNG